LTSGAPHGDAGGGNQEVGVLKEVTMREIEAIFGVTDRLGISREALGIPLMPRTPGRVRRLPNGRIEIVADAADFPGFVAGLEEALRAAGVVQPPDKEKGRGS
jgi:hypothetical protein